MTRKQIVSEIIKQIRTSGTIDPIKWELYDDNHERLIEYASLFYRISLMGDEITDMEDFLSGTQRSDLIKDFQVNIGYTIYAENKEYSISVLNGKLILVSPYTDKDVLIDYEDDDADDITELELLKTTDEYNRDRFSYDTDARYHNGYSIEDFFMAPEYNGSLRTCYVDPKFRHLGFQNFFFNTIQPRLFYDYQIGLRCLITTVNPFCCNYASKRELNSSEKNKTKMKRTMIQAIKKQGFRQIENSDNYIKDFMDCYYNN